jgi:hypothetical protein
MVREERKEMIRREFLSKIKFKKKSAPQMKKSRNRGVRRGLLLESLIDSCARDRQAKPTNKNSSVELQERGRDK